MNQYWDIKAAHKDKILMFRMGDFFEMFYEDAQTAAPILGIALTARNKKEGRDIPMCGVPFHSSEAYLEKLISQGFKVAICEQTETPTEAKARAKADAKKLAAAEKKVNAQLNAAAKKLAAKAKAAALTRSQQWT